MTVVNADLRGVSPQAMDWWLTLTPEERARIVNRAYREVEREQAHHSLPDETPSAPSVQSSTEA